MLTSPVSLLNSQRKGVAHMYPSSLRSLSGVIYVSVMKGGNVSAQAATSAGTGGWPPVQRRTIVCRHPVRHVSLRSDHPNEVLGCDPRGPAGQDLRQVRLPRTAHGVAPF